MASPFCFVFIDEKKKTKSDAGERLGGVLAPAHVAVCLLHITLLALHGD